MPGWGPGTVLEQGSWFLRGRNRGGRSGAPAWAHGTEKSAYTPLPCPQYVASCPLLGSLRINPAPKKGFQSLTRTPPPSFHSLFVPKEVSLASWVQAEATHSLSAALGLMVTVSAREHPEESWTLHFHRLSGLSGGPAAHVVPQPRAACQEEQQR